MARFGEYREVLKQLGEAQPPRAGRRPRDAGAGPGRGRGPGGAAGNPARKWTACSCQGTPTTRTCSWRSRPAATRRRCARGPHPRARSTRTPALEGEMMDASPTGVGRLKKAHALRPGTRRIEPLSERGVHSVRRVPRPRRERHIHTSTVTVAVLPKPRKRSASRSTSARSRSMCTAPGPGGRASTPLIRRSGSAHLPRGSWSPQRERSEIENRAKALRVLRARLSSRTRTAADHAADRRTAGGHRPAERAIRPTTSPNPDHRPPDRPRPPPATRRAEGRS